MRDRPVFQMAVTRTKQETALDHGRRFDLNRHPTPANFHKLSSQTDINLGRKLLRFGRKTPASWGTCPQGLHLGLARDPER